MTFFSKQTPAAASQPAPPEIAQFAHRHGFFSPIHPLASCLTESEKDVAICCDFLEKIDSLISHKEAKQAALGEMLTKVLAYRTLKVGMEIPIDGRVYRVDAVFDLWRGMPAFGLVSGKDAILLFRGTVFSLSKAGIASVLSDLDFKGPGFTTYQRARPQLRRWLQDKNARAFGVSLGGAFVAYTALYERDLLSKEKPSIAFNTVGVFKRAKTEWEKADQKPLLISYVVSGDFISKIGHLLGDVRSMAAPRKLKPIEAHVTLMFAEVSGA